VIGVIGWKAVFSEPRRSLKRNGFKICLITSSIAFFINLGVLGEVNGKRDKYDSEFIPNHENPHRRVFKNMELGARAKEGLP